MDLHKLLEQMLSKPAERWRALAPPDPSSLSPVLRDAWPHGLTAWFIRDPDPVGQVRKCCAVAADLGVRPMLVGALVKG